jgi:hypothetical protein
VNQAISSTQQVKMYVVAAQQQHMKHIKIRESDQGVDVMWMKVGKVR